jgi:hypothetical protein
LLSAVATWYARSAAVTISAISFATGCVGFQSLAGEFGVSLDNHEHVAKFESAAIGELSPVFYRVGERRVVH